MKGSRFGKIQVRKLLCGILNPMAMDFAVWLLLSHVLLVVFLLGPAKAYATLDEGLVAYYPFNGNANDESGNGNHGTVYGATLTTDRFGNPNSAYSFDGVDDYINIGKNASLKMTDGLTICAWINMFSFPGSWEYQNIISDHAPNEVTEGPGKILRFDGNNLQFLVGGIYGFGTAIYVQYPFTADMLGEWLHIAGTYDRNTVKLYINGVEVASCPYTEPLTVNSNPVLIGKSGFDNDFFHGIVDDIRIYNRALSKSEIEQLYINETPFPYVTLISPSDHQVVTLVPTFQISGIFRETKRLKFKIELLSSGKVVKTFDQTQDPSGWDKSDYASSEVATFTVPEAYKLTPGYYKWRAYATADGLSWSPASATWSFLASADGKLPELPLGTTNTISCDHGDFFLV